MPLIVCRHGERLDYAEKPQWTRNAERPWDPPLTSHGKEQAFQAGESMKKKIEELKYPPVAAVYCSPLIRCVETAHEIVKAMGMQDRDVIKVETSLTETICEAWYRSWAIKDVSDSTWGGPPGHETGTPLDKDQLSSHAFVNANELYLDSKTLKEMTQAPVSLEYERTLLDGDYCFDKYETEEETTMRVGKFAEMAQKRHPDQTVILVSHGGPTGLCYEYLMEAGPGQAPLCGYTAVFVYKESERPEGDETRQYKWDCVVSADISHLGDVSQESLGYAATGRA